MDKAKPKKRRVSVVVKVTMEDDVENFASLASNLLEMVEAGEVYGQVEVESVEITES